ncbi:MAG: protein kinase [Cyanobacteria bacterium P01_E01_bin.35]
MSKSKLDVGSKVGCWTLQRRIGEGGNGIVWECVDLAGRSGALKVLKSYLLEVTKDSEKSKFRNRKVQRFLDEISFLRSKQGTSGIITLLDYYLPNSPTKDERPWLVMPIANPLPRFVQSENCSFQRIVEIFRDLSATLSTLHSEGITHRDIKPDNILMLDEKACLSDFGLVDFHEKEAVTVASEILGPQFFVAPEMMSNGDNADASLGDVYSLAKSLWVVASGQKFPLPGEQRLGIPALSLSAYVRDPRAKLLDPILDRCTRFSPNERPLARELHEELNAWCQPLDSLPNGIEQLKQVSQSFADVSTSARRELDRQELFVDSTKQLMKGVEKRLLPLNEEFSKIGSSKIIKENLLVDYYARLVLMRGNDNWQQGDAIAWEYGKPLWRGMRGTETKFAQVNGQNVVLICGVALIILKDLSVLIRSGALIYHDRENENFLVSFILDLFREKWQIVLTKNRIVPAGSSKAEAALNELVT